MFKCVINYSTYLPTRKNVVDAISEHPVVVLKNKSILGDTKHRKLTITAKSREIITSFLKDANKNQYSDIRVCYLREVPD